MRGFAAGMVALGVSAAAQAQTLEYNWEPGVTMHYKVQAFVKAPRILRFYASENLDARVVEVAMGLELDCVPEEPGRRSQDWGCSVHRVQLGGLAFEGEQAKLDSILAEYSALLKESAIELEWSLRGRLKTVDLEGFSKRNDREQIRYEYLRLLVQRALSALEVELPKRGDASKKWRQKGSPLAMRLPTRFGTAGGVRLEHEVTGDNGSQVAIQSVGRGTVSSGQSIESGVDNAVSLSLIGNVLFDVEGGDLLRNELNVQGALNTSSSGATDGFYLSQFVLVEKMDGWETPPEQEEGLSEDNSVESASGGSEAASAADSPSESVPTEVEEEDDCNSKEDGTGECEEAP